jgi:hypothetical protein
MRHSNVAAIGRGPIVGNASRRAPGKEHGARLLPEEQPANVHCLGWPISSVSRDANVVYTAWASTRLPARITWRENLSISSN